MNKDLKSAKVTAKAEVEGGANEAGFELFFEGQSLKKEIVNVKTNLVTAIFTIRDPQLWFPARYGQQPMYTIIATLVQGHKMHDLMSKRFGIRRAEVIQRKLKDAAGTTFFFEINNIPIFCGGSNWIPADSFIPRISSRKYRDWLKLAVDGNQVMIRVWGGGVFEAEAFYDACDELGILIWQDFMFACGNYPGHKEFLASVKREGIANVKRLRHHPSIVIWAGNNEDYSYAESELDYDPNDNDPHSWLRSDFPARYIYEKILVDVMKEFDPGTFYHFGSPYGGKDTRDPTIGDIHQWNGRC